MSNYVIKKGTITLEFELCDGTAEDTGHAWIDVLGLINAKDTKQLAATEDNTVDTTASEVIPYERKPRKKPEQRIFNIDGKMMDLYELGAILHPEIKEPIRQYRKVGRVLESEYQDPVTGEYNKKGFSKWATKEVRKAKATLNKY